jgi:hypothetical protein
MNFAKIKEEIIIRTKRTFIGTFTIIRETAVTSNLVTIATRLMTVMKMTAKTKAIRIAEGIVFKIHRFIIG